MPRLPLLFSVTTNDCTARGLSRPSSRCWASTLKKLNSPTKTFLWDSIDLQERLPWQLSQPTSASCGVACWLVKPPSFPKPVVWHLRQPEFLRSFSDFRAASALACLVDVYPLIVFFLFFIKHSVITQASGTPPSTIIFSNTTGRFPLWTAATHFS